MFKIVFTGPAVDSQNRPILREDLIAHCRKHGIEVQSYVRPDTVLLVASRTDTKKARDAQARGIKVARYQDFIGVLFDDKIPAVSKMADKFVDAPKQEVASNVEYL